jgi:hypothetical protein
MSSPDSPHHDIGQARANGSQESWYLYQVSALKTLSRELDDSRRLDLAISAGLHWRECMLHKLHCCQSWCWRQKCQLVSETRPLTLGSGLPHIRPSQYQRWIRFFSVNDIVVRIKLAGTCLERYLDRVDGTTCGDIIMSSPSLSSQPLMQSIRTCRRVGLPCNAVLLGRHDYLRLHRHTASPRNND